ncbi:DUF1810 family protein [Mucilaginibacter aquariorum]|uniref:DUF1810 domain-containing protein n=1 Tax=Mucilaginibacter aquariorum TaxID=2967225 RepID=A0ABT1SXJ7_9SPHI|nr:DUF1810 family protein [Mucilaginibacter aquariorum]MCQ6957076.1 DUF1810 domain-containing protein [Mucilaginibacter aquariorum]
MQIGNLNRFIEAQQSDYQSAFDEVSRGKKSGHWMWYIFPQIEGLGFSEMSKKYAIKDIREAEAYLMHPILGERLVAISRQLIKLNVHKCHTYFRFSG